MRRAAVWAAAALLLAAVTAAGRATGLNAATIGFAYLVAVLFLSVWGGLLTGTVSAVAAVLCYNFFFFEPLYTFRIEEPANWFALAAFLVSSVTVNRLVVAARVQAEAAAQRTSLLRAISHDLVTPITAMTIRTESMRRRAAADPELLADVEIIAEETARLRRRIDNLLSMARLEAGTAQARREPSPPADLFRALREHLPQVFAARPVTVSVGDDCPDANVDPSLTLEILVNLLENAHRVSPPGERIELAAQRHGAGNVRIEVRDRGPGPPPAADHAAEPRGLGLQIARSLAAANGGTIALEPRAGGGAVAAVDLPGAHLPSEVP